MQVLQQAAISVERLAGGDDESSVAIRVRAAQLS
jgi:hypothetical protein